MKMEITTISVGRDVLIAPHGAFCCDDSGRARCPHRAASRLASLGSRGILKYAACVLIVAFAIGEAGAVSTAPINPAFKEWQRRRSDTNATEKKSDEANASGRRLLSANSGVEERPLLGHVPSSVDYSYLKNINYQQVAQAATVTFPTRFDLRDEGVLTSVKYQNPWGTCWAHATIGSLESGVLMQGGASIDLSEWHLANTHGFDYVTKNGDGGNGDMSIAYLTRWSGPISENEDPYPSVYRDSPIGTPVGHVQNVKILTPMTTAYDTEEIKKTLMEHGSIYAGYLHLWAAESSDEKSYYWNGDTSMYQSQRDGGGHAVQIVGWDDNYSKSKFRQTPPGNGAFICKNSWGTSYGENGYFYVSYYDAMFGSDELYSFFDLQDTKNYDGIYQYDPLGHVNNCGGTSPCWGANIFRCGKDNEEIAAVGFYSLVKNTKYVIEIYTDCSDSKPTSGNRQISQSGTCDFVGYVTVPLSSSVQIKNGRLFSVVIKLTTPGYSYPLAYEAYFSFQQNGKTYWTPTSEATASAGQSFMSQNGTSWMDFTTAVHPTANFCCKAYTKSAAAPAKTLSSVAITGVNSLQSGKTAQFTCKAKYSDGSDADVTSAASWNIASGSEDYASVDSTGLVTAKSVTQQQTAKVHAEYTEGGVTKSDDWSFYVTIAPPEPPTNLEASRGEDASCVRVKWTESTGASSYSVYRGTTASSSNAKYLQDVTVPKFNDNDADPGVKLYYFVKAKNASGTSGFSAGAQGWKALSAPEGVTASDGTSVEHVEITWTEAAGAKFYRVYRSEDLDGEKTELGSSWQTETLYRDTTAVPGQVYYYYVRSAIDSSGALASDYGVFDDGYIAVPVTLDFVTITGEPKIPSGGDATYACTATYTDKSTRSVARPSWSIIAGGDYATVDSTGKVTAGIVTANQTVTLQASYTDGVNRKATKDITIAAVKPSAPASVVLKSASTEAVTISWSSVADAAGYSVWRGSSTADAKKIADVDAETAEYADNSGAPGVSYTYWVKASNAAGESGFSTSSVTATLGLAEPTGVAATDGTYTDKTLVSWKPTIGASHYRVARAGSMTGSKTELGNWQAATSYEDKSGTAGTHYWYFVKAATGSDGANASAYSVSDEGWRKVAVALSSIEISGATKLAAGGSTVFSCAAKYTNGSSKTVKPNWSASPTSAATIDADGKLTAKNVAENVKVTVTAEFTDGVTKTDTHEVLIVAPIVASAEVKNVQAKTRWPFSNFLDVDFELVTHPAGTRALVTLSGHDDDKGVAMAARTLTGDGASGPVEAGKHRLTWDVAADYPDFHTTSFSVEMSAVPMSANMPSNVTASAGTSAEGVDIAWAAIDDATGYEVWRNTDSATNGAERIQTTDQVSYTDTDAVAGTTYWYWVRSVTEDGTSDFGKPVSGWRAYADITVAFNPNGGSASSTSKTYSPTKAYGSLPTASRTGYDFDGWYTASSGGTKVTTSSTVPMANTTLWAHWTAHTYTILFNANGGSGSMSDLAMTYDVAKNLTANAFTKSGNNFKGWATSAGGSVAYTDGSSVKNLTAGNGATITLFAVWEANVPAVSLAEAVDNTDLVFTTGGAANWTVDTAVSYTGGSSARSGVISHNQSTWIKTTLTGAGRVSFRWNASCENPFDKATFAVDGVTKAQTSSTNGWLLVEQEVTGTGTHELTWTYAKDSSMSSGSDCVWLDAVTFVESSSSLPSSFDLRTTGRVTPVKSVGDYSSCWAFDAIAALESTMKTSSGIAYDLSENNMINLAGFDYGFNDGGMFDMATAYLLRWDGPVLESEDPYPSIGTSVRRTPAFHVQNIIDLPGKSSSLDHEHVKQAVFDHGGVYATFNFQNSYYNTATRSYRMPSAQSASHNSTGVIVGWDDSYSRTKFLVPPTGDGAYIVRMSYGSSWGENGYMYVSYYDALFATAMMHVVQGESASRYTRNYQYDPLGHTASVGCSYGANMFTAAATESLAAVGVYVLGANAVYDIKVRVGCAAGNPLSGQLAHSQTARFEYGGFYTVPFTTPVPVASGERFSVVVSMTVPGCDYPMAIEYAIDGFTSGATAAAGQSFYSANGVTWSDLTGLAATANFCCKVYAQGGSTAPTAPTNVSATDGTYPDKVAISWSPVDGAESYSIYRSASSNSESATLVGSTSATSYVDTDISQGVIYYYWVRSVRGGVVSAWSESASGRSVAPPAPVLTLADAVENAGITLTTGGGANWTIDTTVGYSGGNSARSGTVGDLQSSWMETVVIGPGTFSFRWKVSSEEEYDIFTWTLDGVEQGEISGETDWALVTKELTTGSHTIRWIYTKDEDGGGGSDCGWVDVVEVPILPPTNVSAGDGTATASVKILWSATPGATGYTVWRGETGDATQAEQVGTSTSTSYTDKSGTPGQTYYYWVTATDGTRTSVFSTSDTGYRALAAPTNIAASDNTLACGVCVMWDAVEGADGYAVYRSATSTSDSATQIATSMGPAYVDVEVAADTKSYYFIKATRGDKTSAFSAYDKGTRKAGNPLYVVVDLSGGTTAANYPLLELDDVPSGGWTDEYKTNKLVLRRIANGSFTMGSPSGEVGRDSDEDRHSVTISKPFYMGVFEVTQKQYQLVMGSKPSYFSNASYYATRPVERVPYNTIRGSSDGAKWPSANSVDGSSFMGKIRARTGLTFDLPTEAQWEYACRAGTTTALNSGKNLTSTSSDSNMNEVGRYGYNSGYYPDYSYSSSSTSSQGTAAVGSYKPNNWGLYDMHGNVWEWCLDWYQSSLGTSVATDPKGTASGSGRVIRGGCWSIDAQDCRSAYRHYRGPSNPLGDGGFRLCCPAELPAEQATVSFDANGGSGTMAAVTTGKGGSFAIPKVTFTRTGYTFQGWATSTSGNVVYADGDTIPSVSNDIVLYAHWKKVVDLMPLSNLLSVIDYIEKGDGVISDIEISYALSNPTLANMDGDTSSISSEEREILQAIATLNNDKTLLSNVISGNCSGIDEAMLNELQQLSDRIKRIISE